MNDTTVNRMVIWVADSPGHEFACVHVAGDIESIAEAELTTALDHLARLRCATVCIDLGDVAFAGTALLTFLVRVINRAPADTPVLLCRPGRLTRRLLRLSFLDTIATVRDDLPFDSGTPDLIADSDRARRSRIHPYGWRLAGFEDQG